MTTQCLTHQSLVNHSKLPPKVEGGNEDIHLQISNRKKTHKLKVESNHTGPLRLIHNYIIQ